MTKIDKETRGTTASFLLVVNNEIYIYAFYETGVQLTGLRSVVLKLSSLILGRKILL